MSKEKRSAPFGLLACARLLEQSLVYEIKKDERAGDGEGARLKNVTLRMVRAAISQGAL